MNASVTRRCCSPLVRMRFALAASSATRIPLRGVHFLTDGAKETGRAREALRRSAAVNSVSVSEEKMGTC